MCVVISLEQIKEGCWNVFIVDYNLQPEQEAYLEPIQTSTMELSRENS